MTTHTDTTDFDNTDLFQHLRALDAAPATGITGADHDRRETMLFGIIAGERTTDSRRTSRKKRIVWGSIGASMALVGAAAFGAVVIAPQALHAAHTAIAGTNGPFTTTQLAAWTSTPTPITESSPLAKKAQAWCVTHLTGINGTTGTPTITNLDARGTVASLVYQVDGQVYYCVSGGDGTGVWNIGDSAPAPGNTLTPSSALIDSAEGHGSDPSITFVVGFAGTDVASVTLHEPGHPNIATTLENGRWTAWWPVVDDSAGVGGPTGTATITLKDGTSTTVTSSTLYQK